MQKWITRYACAFGLAVILLSACSGFRPAINNARAAGYANDSTGKPYLVLISLDGFRWDYVERFKPPHLFRFIKNGVQAASLIPCFPSKTFPNHYSIATGMYPDKHKILGNSFFTYRNNTTYNMSNRQMVEDGSYYGGTPIWVQAGKVGMVTASYFFAGTEADIQGYRPDYYFNYDGSIKNETRVAQANTWLQLPAQKRPHLITLYFSDMDDVGHKYGPNADSILKKTLFSLDSSLGNLFRQIDQSGLPVNIIIVSDHGMFEMQAQHYLPVEMIENKDQYLAVNTGAIVNIHPRDEAQTNLIYNNLKQQEKHFKVYRTKDTPGFEYVPVNKDWGAIQVIPQTGYYFTSERSIQSMKSKPKQASGVHGYDPQLKEMHGIFYANGPAFKKGYSIAAVKNIHVYPLMCKVLGLDIPGDIDGKLEYMEALLINHKKALNRLPRE